MRELLLSKNPRHRADLKSEAMALLSMDKKFAHSGFEIETRGLEKIDAGVEIYARAWKDGKQLGFGADGSVEWERFRFFNPPILVSDPDGDIVQEWIDDRDAQVKQRKLREDHEEALKRILADAIRLAHREGAIEPGKVGQTTSTFYPDLGVTTIDGYAEQFYSGGSGVDWSVIRGAAGNNADSTRSTNSIAGNLLGDTVSGKWREIIRGIFLFDTSSIPDTDEISSATFSLFIPSVTDALNQAIGLVSSAPAVDTSVLAGDYDSLGTTRFASDIDITAITTSAYNDFTLNASGIAAISKTGNTKFGTRLSGDLDNVEPTWSSGIEPRVDCYCADATGTTEDPKLVVVHAAPTTPLGSAWFM